MNVMRDLKQELHKLIFGDCCGYDMEQANPITPLVVIQIRHAIPHMDRRLRAYAKRLLPTQ